MGSKQSEKMAILCKFYQGAKIWPETDLEKVGFEPEPDFGTDYSLAKLCVFVVYITVAFSDGSSVCCVSVYSIQ